MRWAPRSTSSKLSPISSLARLCGGYRTGVPAAQSYAIDHKVCAKIHIEQVIAHLIARFAAVRCIAITELTVIVIAPALEPIVHRHDTVMRLGAARQLLQ